MHHPIGAKTKDSSDEPVFYWSDAESGKEKQSNSDREIVKGLEKEKGRKRGEGGGRLGEIRHGGVVGGDRWGREKEKSSFAQKKPRSMCDKNALKYRKHVEHHLVASMVYQAKMLFVFSSLQKFFNFTFVWTATWQTALPLQKKASDAVTWNELVSIVLKLFFFFARWITWAPLPVWMRWHR